MSVCTLHRPKCIESRILQPNSEKFIKIPGKSRSHIFEDKFCFEALRHCDPSTFLYKISTFKQTFKFPKLQIRSNFFSDMLSCSCVDRYHCFGETCCIHLNFRRVKCLRRMFLAKQH